MNRADIGRLPVWACASVVAALACALYLPFLNNPRVFDDWVFFSGEHFFYYATHPLGLGLRLLPYFTLALTEVTIGGMPAHRLVSLAFHLACSLMVFKLSCNLLRTVSAGDADDESRARTWSMVGASLFALHPVGVYAAGYLVERTIVIATLFSLASLVLFVRGLRRRSHADAVSAALLYSLAVLSKEHSLLLPAAALLTVPLTGAVRGFGIRYAWVYLAACAPAALFAVLVRKGVIGTAYEPYFGLLASQMEDIFGIKDLSLWMSIVTQAALFFRYLAAWLLPDTEAMSIDVRVDFLRTWSPVAIVLESAAFLAYGALGFALWRRGGRTGLVGFGLLYPWVMYIVEFSAARFQEPFVLYRSYLWAPGWALAFAAASSKAPPRAALAAVTLAGALLFYQARDRLATFSDSLALWKDAVAKLPDKPVPWGSRTLYMAAREYVYSAQPGKAMELAERCLGQYRRSLHCHYARGVIYLLTDQPAKALPDLIRAVELDPQGGITHHRLGLVLERLGRFDDAKAEYRTAVSLGFAAADFELKRLESARLPNRYR
ncbi:MAG TPA: hypothetical protein VI319_10225 [Burkholderiales bacterium]